ncbi:(2Fe-2S)-binding protein [Streptomyces sp. NPDC001941]|uniref:(2Fe-2S)-binding protein n=1 Tax=Streptomyces sp. NPDC001941 TaxID=3154659 RepID=UPI00332645B7
MTDTTDRTPVRPGAAARTACAHVVAPTAADADELLLLALDVNGTTHEVLAPARRTLVDVLRHDLGLTGTHVGCEHGICGACTVLVDGAPARACLMFAAQAESSRISTVESLADPETGELSDLQQAFTEHHGLQCGFCTPGFLMLAEGFLARRPSADKDEIRDAVSANLCRCTGYQSVVEAIDACAGARRAAAVHHESEGAQTCD